MGQSQGGGTAWAGAQRQYEKPMEGYLGTVAASPFTDVLADIAADASTEDNVRVAGIAQGLNSVLLSFELSDWITPIGIARIDLMSQIGGCGTVAGYMFSGSDGNAILEPGWNTSAAASWYSDTTTNGGKPFRWADAGTSGRHRSECECQCYERLGGAAVQGVSE